MIINIKHFKDCWSNYPPLEGDRGQIIGVQTGGGHSAASLNPSHVMFFISFIVPVIWRWNGELHTHLLLFFFLKKKNSLCSSSEAPNYDWLSDVRFHPCTPWKALVEISRGGRLHIFRVGEERKRWRGGSRESSPRLDNHHKVGLNNTKTLRTFLPAFMSLLKVVHWRWKTSR